MQTSARAVQKYAPPAPKLAAWLEENLPDGRTCLKDWQSSFPLSGTAAYCGLPAASNASPRQTLNREVKRRTRGAGIFPNEASPLRLVSAALVEISGDRQAGEDRQAKDPPDTHAATDA